MVKSSVVDPYDERNMTLQSSLDSFVSACDVAKPAPSPMKKRRKPLEKAIDSSASYGGNVDT
ncbi:hypothetical protein PsorP6_010153 [Peronosclerospora sorghi]|uniref:Uncharacterized protein n=1 Tax=Peronosclerospora sorghi TaxID=230839 RepID=A0ACC0VW14_9STRA|nr:hypothetical protein PsorP6_010153 [Peronosclerospora sorghi]